MKHKVFALFGATAVLLTATVALTLPARGIRGQVVYLAERSGAAHRHYR